MKKSSLLFLSGMILLSIPAFSTRVTHTYADGSQEVYYTDMDCSEVNAWVGAHPEWQGIVSCDPEVIVAPPTDGVITVNSVKIKVPVLKDFSTWVKPTGQPAEGYITRISGTKTAGISGGSSILIQGIIAAAALAAGYFAGRFRRK